MSLEALRIDKKKSFVDYLHLYLGARVDLGLSESPRAVKNSCIKNLIHLRVGTKNVNENIDEFGVKFDKNASYYH